MPPEQARGLVAQVDRQSDVFALGAILCEVLTGEPPYTGSHTEAILLRATEADLGETLARLRGCGADPELVRLAERCLAPRKADRPADAGAVAEAVAAYLTGVEERLQQERLRREREQVQRAEEHRRRKLWLGLAAAVLVVLLAGIVGTTLGLIRARQAGAAEAEQRRIAEDNERRADAQRKQAIEFRDKALGALRATTSEDVEKLIGEKGELGANERAYLEAIAKRWQTFADQEGADEQSRALRGEGHARVASLWRNLGRLDEARREYEQARDIRQELADQFPDVPAYQDDLAKTHNGLGTVFNALRQWDEARAEYEQVLGPCSGAGSHRPPRGGWRRPAPTTTWGSSSSLPSASETRPGANTSRLATSGRSWPTNSPTSPPTRTYWPPPTPTWALCSPPWPRGRRRGTSSGRR